MRKCDLMAAAVLAYVGAPYVYATSGQKCTPSMRRERANAKPAYADNIKKYCPVLSGKKSNCDGCKYNGKPAFDCRGLTYECAKEAGLSISSIGATSQWKGDSWIEKGPIANMPKDVPCMVFKQSATDVNTMNHTGIYVGDGTVVDSRGHATGTVRNALSSYPWTHYAIPKGAFDEVDSSASIPPASESVLVPTLRKGDKGDDVTYLQSLLVALGYSLPQYGIDGSFGNETLAAVKGFQLEEGLTVDGIVGPKTWAALDQAISAKADRDESASAKYSIIVRDLRADEAAMIRDLFGDRAEFVA